MPFNQPVPGSCVVQSRAIAAGAVAGNGIPAAAERSRTGESLPHDG